MYKCSLSSLFDIQLFGEGGGAGGGTGAGAAGEGPAGAEGAVAQPSGVNRNPLADVKYGKQESAQDAAVPQIEDRNAQFEALIKGEYKDLYDQRVQDTIQKRLKGTSETVQKYQALTPVLQMLGDKYGVDAGDVEALSKAIENDETFYENEAIERGMTVEQVKEIRRMERENAELKAQMEEAQMRSRADALYSAWMEQSEQTKKVYPGFDLQNELQNEQFRNLLQSNVPVQTAFEVIHKDEIIPAAMQYTAQKIEEKVANSIRAGKNRPQEGAMGNRSPVQVKSDVSQLTKADIQEINRRVARGERITF